MSWYSYYNRNDLKNGTSLEFINIIGLFGKYNINIYFSNKVNIYVGENGLGKTTVLKFIYYLISKKFEQLANINFDRAEVKFSNEDDQYEFSSVDLKEYNRMAIKSLNKLNRFNDEFIVDVIEKILQDIPVMRKDNFDFYKQELISRELAEMLHMPYMVAKKHIEWYFINKNNERKRENKGDKGKVKKLEAAISKYVKQRIIYLPTYRRIENEFNFSYDRNLDNKRNDFLIKFGMDDVQNAIDLLLDKIQSLAIEEFNSMTGVLLKNYLDRPKKLDDMEYLRQNERADIVKIVLDRVGSAIAEKDKLKILDLVNNYKIQNNEYLYLRNLLNELIKSYQSQKEYDDSIKMFVDMCNKYLIAKHFPYNPTKLTLKKICDDGIKSNVLNLQQLSSGEKQIVSLFSKIYLEDSLNSIIIIDEPELSLSLNWQKMLLPDIIQSNKCDLLVTVTHSPFIFDNEFDVFAKEMKKIMYIR